MSNLQSRSYPTGAPQTGDDQPKRSPVAVRFTVDVLHLPATPMGLLGPRASVEHARLHEPELGR